MGVQHRLGAGGGDMQPLMTPFAQEVVEGRVDAGQVLGQPHRMGGVVLDDLEPSAAQAQQAAVSGEQAGRRAERVVQLVQALAQRGAALVLAAPAPQQRGDALAPHRIGAGQRQDRKQRPRLAAAWQQVLAVRIGGGDRPEQGDPQQRPGLRRHRRCPSIFGNVKNFLNSSLHDGCKSRCGHGGAVPVARSR